MNKRLLVYILKRIIWCFIVLLGISIISFGILHLTPGDPARLLLPSNATDEEINNFEYVQELLEAIEEVNGFSKQTNKIDLIKGRINAIRQTQQNKATSN